MFAKQNEFSKGSKNQRIKKIKVATSEGVATLPSVSPVAAIKAKTVEEHDSLETLPTKASTKRELETVDLIELIKTKPYRYSFKNSLFKGYKDEFNRAIYNIDFNRIYMESCAVVNSKFYACNMFGGNFCFSFFKNSDFDTVNLATSRFTECNLENLNFKNSNLQKGIFDGSILKNVVFKRCNLTNIDFSRLQVMENVEFRNCHVEFMILPHKHQNISFFTSLSKENEEVANAVTKDWSFEQHCRARKVILTDKDGKLIED